MAFCTPQKNVSS